VLKGLESESVMEKTCPIMSYRTEEGFVTGPEVVCLEQECALWYQGAVGADGYHWSGCSHAMKVQVDQALTEILDDIRKNVEAINECVAMGVPITVDESPGLVALAQAVIDRLRKTL
jgi:hypothetical protein